MNNRYICKAKRKDNGEWIEGYLVKHNERYYIYYEYADEMCQTGNYLSYKQVISETVGECTSFTDVNSELLFTGDIVESRGSENKEDWKRWVIVFFDGSYCFEREIPRKRKYKYEQNLLCDGGINLYGLTKIGNIHDNPELLERYDK